MSFSKLLNPKTMKKNFVGWRKTKTTTTMHGDISYKEVIPHIDNSPNEKESKGIKKKRDLSLKKYIRKKIGEKGNAENLSHPKWDGFSLWKLMAKRKRESLSNIIKHRQSMHSRS